MTLPIRRDRVRPGAAYQRPSPPALSGVLLNGLRRAADGLIVRETALRRLLEMGLVKRAGKGNGWHTKITEKGAETLRAITEKGPTA